jgi:C1A family cysteine protease
LDWRELKAVTSVKNQGECGSCWAFGVAAYIESKLIIERNYPITTDLSEQYLLSCTPGSDCGGGDPSVALQVVAKKGIPYESSFPYTPYGKVNSKICQATNMITEAGTRYRLIQNITDEKLIQLLQSGPVTVSISSERWHFYSSGVFSCPMNAKIDHGVLVVGYTNSTWIIKNQWGRSWGESGYMRLTRNRNVTGANCLIGMHVPYLDPVVLSVESYAGLISFSTVSLLVVLFALML